MVSQKIRHIFLFLLFPISGNTANLSYEFGTVSREVDNVELQSGITQSLALGFGLPKKGHVLQVQYLVEQDNSEFVYLKEASVQYIRTFRPVRDDDGNSWNVSFSLNRLNYLLEGAVPREYIGWDIEGTTSIPIIDKYLYAKISGSLGLYSPINDEPELAGITADIGLVFLLETRIGALGIKGGYRGRSLEGENETDTRHGAYSSLALFF